MHVNMILRYAGNVWKQVIPSNVKELNYFTIQTEMTIVQNFFSFTGNSSNGA